MTVIKFFYSDASACGYSFPGNVWAVRFIVIVIFNFFTGKGYLIAVNCHFQSRGIAFFYAEICQVLQEHLLLSFPLRLGFTSLNFYQIGRQIFFNLGP